jgi:hypothetical protein
MKVYDPGHIYFLTELDGGSWEVLRFVKREGPGYPGNKGSHPGTTIQEVCRALIDRLDYVNNQIPCEDNRNARRGLQDAIYWLEKRAAERHGRVLQATSDGIEEAPTCQKCGHIECPDIPGYGFGV